MTATPAAVALEPISLPESRDLIALEKVIERGLETFVQVGEALAEIRDRRLHRTEYPTFAEYCKAKWKMSDRRARQLMDAAEVTSTIAKSGTTVPKSERQARPLATLPPSQRVEVWQKAVAASPNGQPTAKAVQVVVEAMNPQPPKTVRVVVDNPKPQTPKTVNVVVQKQIGNDPDSDPPSTPLQWLTHWWTRANREERAAFNNCKDLMPLSNP